MDLLGKNDYGEEKKMFLKLIFTANKKDKPKQFAQGGFFPTPYFNQQGKLLD